MQQESQSFLLIKWGVITIDFLILKRIVILSHILLVLIRDRVSAGELSDFLFCIEYRIPCLCIP